jgi:hypothetical protein
VTIEERIGVNGIVSAVNNLKDRTGKDPRKYRSIKVTAKAKQKLDLIAALLQKPLTQIIEEMSDKRWAELVQTAAPALLVGLSRATLGVHHCMIHIGLNLHHIHARGGR